MQSLYPLQLKPLFKEKIWGGQKISSVLRMDNSLMTNCGEAWLCSGVDGNPTIITNGYLAGNELNELVEVFMGDLVGEKVYNQFGDKFPVLVKLIDSNDWLSIQVHPDDALARKRGFEYGKTEMWYVVQADEQAQLINGFNQAIDKESYLEFLTANNLRDILNFEKVYDGDVFYIPAGRVHALGPGTLIAEIQQTSDITYRIYDWDRTDLKGRKRELHTDEALEAIDFQKTDNAKTVYSLQENKTHTLVSSTYFTTGIVELTKPVRKDYSRLDSFVILMNVAGSASLVWEKESLLIEPGELVVLPQMIQQVELHPKQKAKFLEVYIE